MSASGPSPDRVLLVGAGGLGCAVAEALVRAGLRALTVADDDRVDATNLHRQLCYRSSDVGTLKVEALARALGALAALPGPDGSTHALDLATLPRRLDAAEATALARAHAVVVDATDGDDTKLMLNDACRAAGVALVHGGALGWAAAAELHAARLADDSDGAARAAATLAARGVRRPLAWATALLPGLPRDD